LRDAHAADPAMSVDWAASRLALALVWGVPTGGDAAGFGLGAGAPSRLRAVVWIAMLVWMGLACLANARRCGRTHCYYTGPFFLCMGGLVAADATAAARQSAVVDTWLSRPGRQRADLVDKRASVWNLLEPMLTASRPTREVFTREQKSAHRGTGSVCAPLSIAQ
jgi:hypothetical protein